MSQTQTVGKHATTIHGANGYQIVTYHKTKEAILCEGI